MNELYKTIINIGFIVLASIGVCVTVALGFFMIFNDNKTLGINFIDNQNGKDFVSEIIDGNTADNEILKQFEKRSFFEARLYDNSNGNGIMLQELKMNYFSSPNLKMADYYSSGMQYKDLTKPYEFSWDVSKKVNMFTTQTINNAKVDEFKQLSDFNIYSTVAGLSANWGKSQTPLDRDTYYIVQIDDDAYRIKLQGQFDTRYDSRKWYKPWTWDDRGGDLYNYSFANVFADIMHGIKSNNLGTGTHFAVLDMSDYFTIVEKYIPGSTGGDWVPQKADIVKNYVAIKFYYSNNGAVRSSQSMFGIINDDSRYNIDESRYDTTYWQERVKYNLTNKDLDLRYSSIYNGYFVSLSQDMKTLFKSMPRAEVTISINMTYNDKKIIGLDFNAFKDYRFKTLAINGSGDFYLMTDCLLNSHVETVKTNNLITLQGLGSCGASPHVEGL